MAGLPGRGLRPERSLSVGSKRQDEQDAEKEKLPGRVWRGRDRAQSSLVGKEEKDIYLYEEKQKLTNFKNVDGYDEWVNGYTSREPQRDLKAAPFNWDQTFGQVGQTVYKTKVDAFDDSDFVACFGSLGAGSYGAVYLGFYRKDLKKDLKDRRAVAIKCGLMHLRPPGTDFGQPLDLSKKPAGAAGPPVGAPGMQQVARRLSSSSDQPPVFQVPPPSLSASPKETQPKKSGWWVPSASSSSSGGWKEWPAEAEEGRAGTPTKTPPTIHEPHKGKFFVPSSSSSRGWDGKPATFQPAGAQAASPAKPKFFVESSSSGGYGQQPAGAVGGVPPKPQFFIGESSSGGSPLELERPARVGRPSPQTVRQQHGKFPAFAKSPSPFHDWAELEIHELLCERSGVIEVSCLLALRHKNIVRMLDRYAINETAYLQLVLEYCDGGTLTGEIKKSPKGRMHEQVARYYFKQIIDGLVYINEQGIVHRDLKPDNILLQLSPSGHDMIVKIADFGLAVVYQYHDHAGQLVELEGDAQIGTMIFVPPEALVFRLPPQDLFRAFGTYSHVPTDHLDYDKLGRSLPQPTNRKDIKMMGYGLKSFKLPPLDVYAAGVILYNMLRGATYFPYEHKFWPFNLDLFLRGEAMRCAIVISEATWTFLRFQLLHPDPEIRQTVQYIKQGEWLRGPSRRPDKIAPQTFGEGKKDFLKAVALEAQPGRYSQMSEYMLPKGQDFLGMEKPHVVHHHGASASGGHAADASRGREHHREKSVSPVPGPSHGH